MDPVTAIQLTSSLTSLIKTCRTILQAIKDFKHGDDDLADMFLEVEHFAEFLEGLRRILADRKSSHRISAKVLQSALKEAKKTVHGLMERLQDIQNIDGMVTRRLKWLKDQAELKRLRDKLRNHNTRLSGFLSLVYTETLLLACRQQPPLLQYCSDVEDKMGGEGDIVIDLAPGEISEFVEGIELPSSISDSDSSTCDESMFRSNSGEALPFFGQRRRSCAFNCYCVCHIYDVDGFTATSIFLKQRTVTFGITSRRKPECSNLECRRRTTAAQARKVVIPSAWFCRVLAFLKFSRSLGPRYRLHTYRIVRSSCESMRNVVHGDFKNLKACMENGRGTPFDTCIDGWSLLHKTAAYWGQLSIVQYLLSLGAEVDVGEIGSRKPADLAILRALAIDSTDTQKKTMNSFPNIDSYVADFGFTPIHIAVLDFYDKADVHRPTLQDLIDFVDDANNAPVGNDWNTWRRFEVGLSPLYAEIVDMFRRAAKTSPVKPLLNIIDQPDEKWGWPPFHWAAFTGRLQKMQILISNDADPFILSPMKRNTLHIAAESRRPSVLSYVLSILEDNQTRLDINKADRWGETPLHVAASGSAACVQLLLEKGADPNVQQLEKQVPLHYACICPSKEERLEISNELVNRPECQLNIRDHDGRTPIFELLESPACVELLAHRGADLFIIDDEGNSVLHLACVDNQVGTLEMLLDLTTAIDPAFAMRRNKQGNTPLLEAFIHGSKQCVQYLLEGSRVNCGINIAGEGGWSAVHYAANWGDIHILYVVLKYPGFMKEQKTQDGKSAAWVAKEASTWTGKVKELLRRYDSAVGNSVGTVNDRGLFLESAAVHCSLK